MFRRKYCAKLMCKCANVRMCKLPDRVIHGSDLATILVNFARVQTLVAPADRLFICTLEIYTFANYSKFPIFLKPLFHLNIS